MPLNKPSLFKQTTLSKENFLNEYWHKKPFLFKDAFTSQQLSFLPNKEELIKLSCHPDIQSRIVTKNSETEYDVEIGPFEKEDFTELDDFTWNLLVSDVDKWHPDSQKILKYFDFIRNWIFDDIMISTGSIGGTVGPHTDHYDVFLIQVTGQRQWMFGHSKIYNPELLSDVELKLLNQFNADEDYTLNPGDVLYLPPEVAHYGIAASDDCVTCSIGMRTPSVAELLTDFIDNIAQNLSENNRFEEPEFNQQPAIGQITQQDIEKVKKIIVDNIDSENITQWLGQYLSSYRNIFHEFNQTKQSSAIDSIKGLYLNSFTKACYFTDKETTLFINGDSHPCSLKLAELLCNDKQILANDLHKLNTKDKDLVKQLYQNGALEKLN